MVIGSIALYQHNNMNHQKQFGVWMDNHQATIVGSDNAEEPLFKVVGHVKGDINTPKPSEKSSHNTEKNQHTKFFKEIASHLTNATHVHLTGTGVAQEQFIHYLAATPQFKNSKTSESTSNKMSDEKLIAFMMEKF